VHQHQQRKARSTAQKSQFMPTDSDSPEDSSSGFHGVCPASENVRPTAPVSKLDVVTRSEIGLIDFYVRSAKLSIRRKRFTAFDTALQHGANGQKFLTLVCHSCLATAQDKVFIALTTFVTYPLKTHSKTSQASPSLTSTSVCTARGSTTGTLSGPKPRRLGKNA
jgi:hypothetical protein